MKKTVLNPIALLLVAVLLLSAMPIMTVADGEQTTVSGEIVQAAAGSEIQVPISLKNNAGCSYLQIKVDFDTSMLTLVSVSNGDLFSTLTRGAFIIFSNTGNVTDDGVLATLTFAVSEEASGEYPITITCYECSDAKEQDVPCQTVGGKLNITSSPRFTPASDFDFTTEGDTAAITEYLGSDTVVNIAPTYEIDGKTYTVTAITGYSVKSGKKTYNYGAFMDNTDVVSVSIPDTVETIGDVDSEYYAFYGCTALTLYKIYGNPVIAEGTVGMFYDEESDSDQPVEGAIIVGLTHKTDAESEVQKYAGDSGIAFRCLDIAYKGCQVTHDIKTAEVFNIRFAGVIQDLDYQSTGFEIEVAEPSKFWNSDSKKVYQALKGTTSDGTPITAVTAEKLGGAYITAVVIKNVPTKTALTFVIKPYVTNVNGEKMYGETWNVNTSAEGEIKNVKQ